MSRQTQSSMLLVGALAGGIGFMAFMALMVIGEYAFSPAAFIAILVALAVALFLFVAFHRRVEPPVASEPAASRPEPVAAAAPAPASEPEPAPAPTPAPAPVMETHSPEPAPEPAPAPVMETYTPEPEPAPEPAPQPAPAAATGGGTRPAGLDGPRGGAADDLKRIKGVGPKLEALLNRMGFYHFDQVAGWTADEVAWVDDNLEGFKGRVSRDQWIDQAKLLAAGGETEFSKKVDDGNIY